MIFHKFPGLFSDAFWIDASNPFADNTLPANGSAIVPASRQSGTIAQSNAANQVALTYNQLNTKPAFVPDGNDFYNLTYAVPASSTGFFIGVVCEKQPSGEVYSLKGTTGGGANFGLIYNTTISSTVRDRAIIIGSQAAIFQTNAPSNTYQYCEFYQTATTARVAIENASTSVSVGSSMAGGSLDFLFSTDGVTDFFDGGIAELFFIPFTNYNISMGNLIRYYIRTKYRVAVAYE